MGDTYNCRINGEPARITWKDDATLVIEPDDARVILRTRIDGNLRVFMCGHADASKDNYTVEMSAVGIRVAAKPSYQPNA